MEELILEALRATLEKARKNLPTEKKENRDIDVSDVRPVDLGIFMIENGIPDSADWSSSENGYDGYEGDTLLTWKVTIPVTKADEEMYVNARMKRNAFRNVAKSLIAKGYKRQTVGSGTLSSYFKGVTVHDLFMSGDYERLIKYFKLYFKK